MLAMVVNLIRKASQTFITLPAKEKGQFWLTDKAETGHTRNLIRVEAEDGKWVLKSNKTAWITDGNGACVEKAVLSPMSFYSLEIADLDERVFVFAEPIAPDRQRLNKILVTGACELSIGRAASHSISYDNSFVSESDGRGHARLRYENGVWSVADQSSTNGTYVNGEAVTTRQLAFGDIVYIMGLRIVVGKSFFAINNPEGKVKLQSNVLKAYKPQIPQATTEDEDVPAPSFFYRSPRFKREFEKAEITIDAPPALQKIEQVPLALMLGPSLTMGLTSLTTGILTVSNIMTSGGELKQALPTLFMSISMLLGTILWPILTKRHEKKKKAAVEKERQEKYLAYLDSVRDDIRRKCKEQSEILAENIVTLDECISYISEKQRTLWERILGQNNFLRLRLGRGVMPLNAAIKYPEKKFTLESDSLMDALFSLGKEPKLLEGVPISVSLVDNYISGIVGPRSAVLGLIRSLLVQVAALHSYDELKIVFLVDSDELAEWEFAKWFPHSWDNEKSVRYLATNTEEVKELSVLLEKNILSVRDESAHDNTLHSPYYLIVSANRELALKCDSLNRLMDYKTNCGFSIVTLYDEIQNIPKETHSVIDLNGNEARIYDKDDLSGKAQTFLAETATLAIANRMAQNLANIALDISEQRFALPGMLTFLEMFGVSKVEHLNPLTRWKENNPSLSLQTPVGVDVFGEPFVLDLHEKFHGPHGLVAGTTGSGKSEFIMTYILSLAANYHPDEVAFMLIDFKGGGLAGAFDFEIEKERYRLPHLAGTITNLEGKNAEIRRVMVAIESESKRRQAVFHEAKALSGEGTMDIYAYQRLYRQKIVQKPMPHLFIISDEFAELKAQQPDFMEKLISAARVGRSLGIHLILATQKPAGVVDDQIWSNSKFRVCLKVQEKADSMDMLKCPDAAEITQTGRFYLQVGFNEIFALGQSAWSGADYVPTETVEKKVDSAIRVIDALGRVVREEKPVKKTDGKKYPKQLVSLVQYLSALAAEEGLSQQMIWQEPIPEYIYLADLERKHAAEYQPQPFVLNPLIGEYDNPYIQRQLPLTLPLSAEGNCVVYGSAGNGKTTFLTTLIYSILRHHSAQEVNIYTLDFGRTLTAFENAPQMGGVLLEEEAERIANLFKMLRREFDTRRRVFAPYGGDLQSYNKNAEETKPNILIIINNYDVFVEQFEQHEEDFALLSRDGLKYGITFVVTANSTSAVRYRIQQNFKQLISMQLNEESLYSSVFGKTGGVLPSPYKGRGLVSLDMVYEFQTAYIAENADMFRYLYDFSADLRARSSELAKPVPMMPQEVTVALLEDSARSLQAVPAGIETMSLDVAAFNLKERYIFPIFTRDTTLMSSFSTALAQMLGTLCAETVIFDAEYIISGDVNMAAERVSTDFDDRIFTLFEEIATRHNLQLEAKKAGAQIPTFPEKVMVFLGLSKLNAKLADHCQKYLGDLLERGSKELNVHVVIVESVQDVRAFGSTGWYKKHIAGTFGLWVGDGIGQYTVFSLSRYPQDSIGERFGYLIQGGVATLVKLLGSSTDLREEEYPL